MSSKTVLVVDPNPMTHRKADEAFRGTSCAVIHAKNAVDAQASAAKSVVDVVLSAVGLPSGNGYELARTLRERHPAALIYLLTGGFEVFNHDLARECGVDGPVRRPFSAMALRVLLEDAIGPFPPSQDGPVSLQPGDLAALDAQPFVSAAPLRPPPLAEERLATFLPRDYRDVEPVTVDPEVVMPALERAILEVLPEVVEGVLRTALASSDSFRELVVSAVDERVREQLPELVARITTEQLSSDG